MSEHTTTIAGFRVTVDDDMGDGASGCWIEARGGHSASLECADATGALENSNGETVPISEGTVGRIRTWAESKGY